MIFLHAFLSNTNGTTLVYSHADRYVGLMSFDFHDVDHLKPFLAPLFPLIVSSFVIKNVLSCFVLPHLLSYNVVLRFFRVLLTRSVIQAHFQYSPVAFYLTSNSVQVINTYTRTVASVYRAVANVLITGECNVCTNARMRMQWSLVCFCAATKLE